MSRPKPWPVVHSTVEQDNAIFRLRRNRACSPRTGVCHDFFVLESRDWVNILPITADERLVLVHQYRHGIQRVTLEIPGGIVDHTDEPPAVAAQREMREETGYHSERIHHLGTVQAQPALQNNLCHTFLALDAHPVGPPQPDPGEDLRVETVDLRDVPERVLGGEIRHGLVLAALYWYELWKRGSSRESPR